EDEEEIASGPAQARKGERHQAGGKYLAEDATDGDEERVEREPGEGRGSPGGGIVVRMEADAPQRFHRRLGDPARLCRAASVGSFYQALSRTRVVQEDTLRRPASGRRIFRERQPLAVALCC